MRTTLRSPAGMRPKPTTPRVCKSTSENHLSVRTVLRTPGSNVPLQGAQLPRLIASRLALAQQAEQRLALQRWITLEQLGDQRPVFSKRVGPRAVGPRLLELAGQPSAAFIRPRRAHAHARTCGSLFLSSAFGAFAQHHEDLRVLLHRTPIVLKHDVAPAPQPSASGGKSD
jgi:hypothetical protein